MLEGEEAPYSYYRAPQNMVYRIYDGDKVVDSRAMPGGLFLHKDTFVLLPVRFPL